MTGRRAPCSWVGQRRRRRGRRQDAAVRLGPGARGWAPVQDLLEMGRGAVKGRRHGRRGRVQHPRGDLEGSRGRWDSQRLLLDR